MGRGKRTGLIRTGTVGREIALSDAGRDLRVPAQLASSLVVEGPARFADQTVQAYPEGQRSYVGSAIGIKTGQAEAFDRGSPRALHGRAYLEGEVVVITNALDNEVARAHLVNDRQLQLRGVGGAEGLLLGELRLRLGEDKTSAFVSDRWDKRRGVVQVQSRGSQRGPIDLRLAAVAAYFFLLDQ